MDEETPEEQLDEHEGDNTPHETDEEHPDEPEYDHEDDIVTDGETDHLVLLMATLRQHYQALADKPFYQILGRIRGKRKLERIRRQIIIAHYRQQFPVLAEHAKLEMAIYGIEDGAAEKSLLEVTEIIGASQKDKKKERRWGRRRR